MLITAGLMLVFFFSVVVTNRLLYENWESISSFLASYNKSLCETESNKHKVKNKFGIQV